MEKATSLERVILHLLLFFSENGVPKNQWQKQEVEIGLQEYLDAIVRFVCEKKAEAEWMQEPGEFWQMNWKRVLEILKIEWNLSGLLQLQDVQPRTMVLAPKDEDWMIIAVHFGLQKYRWMNFYLQRVGDAYALLPQDVHAYLGNATTGARKPNPEVVAALSEYISSGRIIAREFTLLQDKPLFL